MLFEMYRMFSGRSFVELLMRSPQEVAWFLGRKHLNHLGSCFVEALPSQNLRFTWKCIDLQSYQPLVNWKTQQEIRGKGLSKKIMGWGKTQPPLEVPGIYILLKNEDIPEHFESLKNPPWTSVVGSKFQEIFSKLSPQAKPSLSCRNFTTGSPYFKGDCKVWGKLGAEDAVMTNSVPVENILVWFMKLHDNTTTIFFLVQISFSNLLHIYIQILYIQIWLVKDLSFPLVSHSSFLTSTLRFQYSVSFIVRININNTVSWWVVSLCFLFSISVHPKTITSRCFVFCFFVVAAAVCVDWWNLCLSQFYSQPLPQEPRVFTQEALGECNFPCARVK